MANVEHKNLTGTDLHENKPHTHPQSEVVDLVTDLTEKTTLPAVKEDEEIADTISKKHNEAHNHDASYEPEDSAIQTHIQAAHAPSDAQKNSDIAKSEIEVKLIGEIESHSHARTVYGISGGDYETIPRNICTETNTSLLSSGRLSLQAIWLPKGLAITSISIWSATTAGATLTNQLFGLYDNSFNLLRESANGGNAAWAANTKKTLALTSSFTTTYSGLHYIGIMVAATTVPTIKGNTARTGGQLAAASPSMGGTSNTGLTTALPNPCSAPGTVTTIFWACVNTA